MTSQFGVFSCQNNNDADPWEFPRHKLKFFNILGEGAFGQVWRCEAININGMYLILLIPCFMPWNLKKNLSRKLL